MNLVEALKAAAQHATLHPSGAAFRISVEVRGLQFDAVRKDRTFRHVVDWALLETASFPAEIALKRVIDDLGGMF